MSSAFLYLAIVAMWFAVLVPMWLKREQPARKASSARIEVDVETSVAGDVDVDVHVQESPPPVEEPEPVVRPREVPEEERRRNQIVARRRRTLLGTLAILAASAGLTATPLVPWWGAVPGLVVLVSYLGVLRAAVLDDARRRESVVLARAEEARRRERIRRRELELERRRAENELAEIIEFNARKRDELYDQYADARLRAVGD